MSAFLSFILPWMERAGNDVFQGDSTMNSLQNSFSGINIRAILCHPHFSNTLLAFYTPHKGHFYCFPGSFSYTKYNDLVMQLGISKNFKKKKESALTMRKQMKIAAVVSAAALLALGASITSFAAQRGTWKYEDGEWYCYDRNGDVYENEFCLSNGREFYVGDDGALVRSSWVEYDGDYYFVNSAGEKITNDWRLTAPYDDEDADEQWFYFQANGRRAEDKKLTIRGKTYFFDADGEMLTGWVEENDDTYEEAGSDITHSTRSHFSYCDETGARLERTWVEDYAPDVDSEDVSSDDEVHYYYLNSSGHPVTRRQTNINGQSYIFGENGRMLTGWVATTATNSDAYEVIQGTDDDEDHWVPLSEIADRGGEVYYCTEDDGHVKKNKWIKLWNTEFAYDQDNDEDQYWFYLARNGEVFIPDADDVASAANAHEYSFSEGKLEEGDPVSVIKHRVNGKDYFFNSNGEMISGFIRIEEQNDDLTPGMYYLGSSNDGVMKTGSVNISDNTGESYRFYFGTRASEGGDGVGYTGNRSNKLYYNGMMVRAEDYRYEIVEVDGAYFIVNQSGSIQDGNTSYREDGDVLIRTRVEDDDPDGSVNTAFYDGDDDAKEGSFASLDDLLEYDNNVFAGSAEDIVFEN